MKNTKLLAIVSVLTGLMTACVTEIGEDLDETSSSVLGVEPEEIDNACEPTTATPDDIAAPDRDTRKIEPEEIDVRCDPEPPADDETQDKPKYKPVITIKPKG